jgi:DNA-binding NarL/FixJ family response regulator
MIKIGIIEDNELLLNNYSEFFNTNEDYHVTFAFESIMALRKAVSSSKLFNPDLILLDINLPGISGIEGISILKDYFPKAKIIMLTAYSDSESIITSLQKGADGYLEKGISLHEIKSSLEIYKKGGSATTSKVVRKMIDYINSLHIQKEETLSKLTKREKQVVNCLINGLSFKNAAKELEVNACTINQHLKKIYIKLNVNSKSELISKILSQNKIQQISSE